MKVHKQLGFLDATTDIKKNSSTLYSGIKL